VPRRHLTAFSWGYYGWGNHTHDLVSAFDAIEESREFKPPLFVDVRIRRAVRATGFSGDNFQRLIGDRYHWIKGLGNQAVLDTKLPRITISDPNAISELFDLCVQAHKENRRIIFFCSCEFPGKPNSGDCCHRTKVATLLLRYAKKHGKLIVIVEFPGGKPVVADIETDEKTAEAIMKGKMYLPLNKKRFDPSMIRDASLPCGSVLRVNNDFYVAAMSANPGGGSWHIPLLYAPDKRKSLSRVKKEGMKWRSENGYDERIS